MRISSNHIKIFSIVLALVLVLVPLGHQAMAQTSSAFPDAVDCGVDVICTGSVVIQWAILGALYAVGKFFGMLILGLSVLIKWGINYSGTIMTLPTVVAGFDVALSFVNLLFIFAIIFIAFKLILGLDEHGSKKMIGNLILAALLVNFSKLIAGVLIDFSNILTNFFLARFDPQSIGGAFEPQKFLDFAGAVIGNGTGYWGDFFTLFPMMLFSTLMTAFAAIILLSVFIMVMYRTVFMAFLLIVMPLIWGCWVMPSFKQYWSEWWDNFMKWIMYLPSVTFFIWLAVSTASLLGTRGGIATGQAPGALGFLENKLGAFVQMLLMGGLLIAGLKAGERSGAFGANLGSKMAGGAGKWAGSRALKFGKAVGGASARTATGVAGVAGVGLGARGLGALAGLAGFRGAAAKLKGVADATSKFGTAQAKFAGGQALSATSEAIGVKGGAGIIKDVQKFYDVNKQQQEQASVYQKEKLAEKTDDEVLKTADDGKGNDAEKFGMLMELQKRGLTGKVKADQQVAMLTSAKNIGAQGTNTYKSSEKTILNSDPRVAAELAGHAKGSAEAVKVIADHIQNKMTPEDAKQIKVEVLNDPNVLFALSNKQLGAISRDASPAKDLALNTVIKNAQRSPVKVMEDLSIARVKNREKYEAAKIAGNKEEMDRLKKTDRELKGQLILTKVASNKSSTSSSPYTLRAQEMREYLDQMAKPHNQGGH